MPSGSVSKAEDGGTLQISTRHRITFNSIEHKKETNNKRFPVQSRKCCKCDLCWNCTCQRWSERRKRLVCIKNSQESDPVVMAARRYNNPLNRTQNVSKNVSKNSKCNMCLVYKRFKPLNGKSCSYNVRKYRHKVCSQSRKTVIHASLEKGKTEMFVPFTVTLHLSCPYSYLFLASAIFHFHFSFPLSSFVSIFPGILQ